MPQFTFSCPGCQVQLKADVRDKGKDVVCPGCGREFPVPLRLGKGGAGGQLRSKRKSGGMLHLVFILACIGVVVGGFLYLASLYSGRSAEKAEAWRLADEAAAVARQEKEAGYTAVWGAAQRLHKSALAGEVAVSEAVESLDRMASEVWESGYADKITSLSRDLANLLDTGLAAVKAELAKIAEEHAARGEFEAAAKVYDDYVGNWAEELADFRRVQAARYRRRVEEKQNVLQQFMAANAAVLLEGDIDFVRTQLEQHARPEMLSGLARALDVVSDANRTLQDAFAALQGQTTVLKIQGQEHQVKIVEVVNGMIRAEKSGGERTSLAAIPVDKLDLTQRHGVLVAVGDRLAADLYAMMAGVAEQDYNGALSIAKAGGDQYIPFQNAIAELRANQGRAMISHALPEEPGIDTPQAVDADGRIAERFIRLEAVIHKRKEDSGTDYDNRQQTYDVRVAVTNSSRQDMKDYLVDIYIFGKSAARRNEYALIKHLDQALSVGSYRKEVTREITFVQEFDNNYQARFGYVYDGYLIVLRAPDGTVAATRSNRSRYASLVDKADKLIENSPL